MKKNSYSSREYLIKNLAKSKGMSLQMLNKLSNDFFNIHIKNGTMNENLILDRQLWNVESIILLNNKNNIIFIEDSGLLELMMNSKPLAGFKPPKLDILNELIYIDNYSGMFYKDMSFEKIQSKSFIFIIKHKNKNYEDIIIEYIESGLNYNDVYFCCMENNIGRTSSQFKKEEVKKIKTKNKLDTFAYNFFLYLYAFPEKIREGVPKDYLFKNEGIQGKRFGLETHPSMIDHSSPIPHVRRGHFRELRNERFGENIGKVIWINETFVKGNAKTIEE